MSKHDVFGAADGSPDSSESLSAFCAALARPSLLPKPRPEPAISIAASVAAELQRKGVPNIGVVELTREDDGRIQITQSVYVHVGDDYFFVVAESGDGARLALWWHQETADLIPDIELAKQYVFPARPAQ